MSFTAKAKILLTSLLLILAWSPTHATIIYGTGSAGTGTNIDLGIGEMYWTRANQAAGYFYGSPTYGADTIYFGDIASPGFWPGYDSYFGVADITEFTDASMHSFATQNYISFAEQGNNYYRGILLFQINGFYGALNPLQVSDNYVLSYEFWYDDTGASDFSSYGAVAVPEPSSLALLGLGLFGVGVIKRRPASNKRSAIII